MNQEEKIKNSRCLSRAFTLIELLIVVLILAILAAISLVNFLEFQTRSKVARVLSDFRTCTVALEAYAVDWNEYPEPINPSTGQGAELLTFLQFTNTLSTPVAYLSNATIVDPFKPIAYANILAALPANEEWRETYHYSNYSGEWGHEVMHPAKFRRSAFALSSFGPDRFQVPISVLESSAPVNGGMAWYPYIILVNKRISLVINGIYDPTNGTVSFGDLARFGGELSGIPTIIGGGAQ